jgi:hypothetical protein
MIAAIPIAAGPHASADLLVGLVLGLCIGFLAGPAIRSRLTRWEWSDASRQARLTDALLDRLEDDPDSVDERGADGGAETGGSWRTSR